MKLKILNKKKYTYGGNISNSREINFKNSFSEKGNLNGRNDDFDNIYQTATPMIADSVVPGLGTVVKAQQGLGNTIVKDNPKNEFNQIVGNTMKYGNPLIGIPKGIIDAKNARKKEDEINAEAYRQEMVQANSRYSDALANGFNPSGNTENRMYKNGGNLSMLNKNVVSGGKLSKLSNDTVEVKGNKHEQGGVMIGNNSEVEGGETIVDKGNKLFVNSDSLINPKTGKTFAETDMFITKQINKLEKDANNEFNKKALNILRMQKEQNMKEQEMLKQQQNIDNQSQGINQPQSFSRGGEILKNLPSYTDNITGALANYSRSKEPVIQKSKLSYLDRNKYDVNNQPLLNNIDASINTANRSIDNSVSDSKVGEALKAQNLATQIRTKNEAINTNEMVNINSRKGIDSFNIGREDANKNIDYENSMAVQMQKDDIRKEYQRNIVNATEKYRMDKLTKDKNQLDSDNNRLSLLSADSKNVEYMVGQLDENDELFKKYPYLLKYKRKPVEQKSIENNNTKPFIQSPVRLNPINTFQ